MVPPQPPPSSKDIGTQLLDELWRRARTSIPAFIIVMAIAWPIVREAIERNAQARLAYTALFVVAFARWVSAIVVSRDPERLSRGMRYYLMLAGALANGLAIGWLDLILYRELNPLALGIWMTCIAGIAGGATVSLGARPEIFLAYSTPAMGAFAIAPLLWPRDLAGVVAAAICVWLLYSFVQVAQYGKSRKEFIVLNLELDAKVKLLNSNNAELARKNLELEEMSRRADRIFAALGGALPGKVLAGKYLLDSRVGTGGFSIVFRGTHVGIGRPVAVKIFRPQAGNDSGASLERFRYEGMASGRIRHPNIVEVLDAGISDDGIPYIAMELLDGGTLEKELEQNKRLPIRRIASIMEQVCLGLAAAHDAKVIHRDVKPENIFLHHDEAGTETVKVLDFGIAKILDAGRHAGQITSTGDLVGTPYYMAPERLLGHESDESADVYSVGLILYRALVGKLPFEGTVAEIMVQAVSKDPPDIVKAVPELTADFGAVIMRALSQEPAERPTAAELATALGKARALGRRSFHAA
ncbi:MAG: protein kinase domain-containing protein [Polyangiaceae bacterium]